MTPEQEEIIEAAKNRAAESNFSTSQQVVIEKAKRRASTKQYAQGEKIDPLNTKEAIYGPNYIPVLDETSAYVEGITDEVASTFTYGLSDYTKGAGGYLKDVATGQPIKDDYRLEAKRKREAWEAENPKAALGANITGAIANPLNTRLSKWAVGPQGTPLLGQVGRGTVAAGTMSAAQSAGTSEGPLLDRAKDVGKATGIGAAIGFNAPWMVKGVTSLLSMGGNAAVNVITRLAGGNVQKSKALRKIGEALQREEMTVEQAYQKVEAIGLDARLLDAGDQLRMLGNVVHMVPSKGRKNLMKFLEDRQYGTRSEGGQTVSGQSRRVTDYVDELLPENYYTEAERLARMNEAEAIYTAAYKANQQIDDPVINKLIQSYHGKQAFRHAVKRMSGKQKTVSKSDPELLKQAKEAGMEGTGPIGKGIKLETLDLTKRRLGDMESSLRRAGNYDEARDVGILRRSLTKAIDNADETARAGPNSMKPEGGLYKQARDLAGDKLGRQDALEAGTTFMSKTQYKTPEAMGVKLADLTPEERHLFRVGAIASIKSAIKTKSGPNAVGNIINDTNLEDKLYMVFDDDAMFKAYVKFVTGEDEMYRTFAKVLGGSQTADKQVAMRDYDIDPSAFIQAGQNIKTGNVPGAVLNIGRGLKNQLYDQQPYVDELSKHLLSRTPPPGLERSLQRVQYGEQFDQKLIDYITRTSPAAAEKYLRKIKKDKANYKPR